MVRAGEFSNNGTGGSGLDSIQVLGCTFFSTATFSNMVRFAYVERVSPSLFVDAYASDRRYPKSPKLRWYGYVGSAEILGDPYLRQISLPRIPDYCEPSVDTNSLPRTLNYCVANTAWSKPSQPVHLNRKTPFSTARHQQRTYVLQSLTNIMTQ